VRGFGALLRGAGRVGRIATVERDRKLRASFATIGDRDVAD
jgi:hypothetical protein